MTCMTNCTSLFHDPHHTNLTLRVRVRDDSKSLNELFPISCCDFLSGSYLWQRCSASPSMTLFLSPSLDASKSSDPPFYVYSPFYVSPFTLVLASSSSSSPESATAEGYLLTLPSFPVPILYIHPGGDRWAYLPFSNALISANSAAALRPGRG